MTFPGRRVVAQAACWGITRRGSEHYALTHLPSGLKVCHGGLGALRPLLAKLAQACPVGATDEVRAAILPVLKDARVRTALDRKGNPAEWVGRLPPGWRSA